MSSRQKYTQLQTPSIDPFFLHKHNDALKTSKKWQAMGEYLWSKDWESYASRILGYANQYSSERKRAADRGLPNPVLRMPLQPENLTHVKHRENPNISFRRQCISPENRRPSMYQGIKI